MTILKKEKYFLLLSISFFFLCLTSCKKGKYQTMLATASTSGIQEDSLTLGIRFGMTKEDFFDHCQKYNQAGDIFDSGTPLQVGQRITWKENQYQMNFYPQYESEKINKLDFEFYHTGFSKWNKQVYSKEIIPEIKSYLEKEFNLTMEEFDHEKYGKAYVVFTGNRRLRIFLKNQKMVGGEFLDMTDQF
jgi:hypothetical protein